MNRILQTPEGFGKSEHASDESKSPSTRYETNDVKAAAVGHWPAIINRVAGIEDDYLSTTHGPCPKCGGNDRWRVFDDFEQTGGAICSQCGEINGKKLGDGFAVIQWYCGIGFPETVKRVAEFLGVQPTKPATKKKPELPKADAELLDKVNSRFLELSPLSEKHNRYLATRKLPKKVYEGRYGSIGISATPQVMHLIKEFGRETLRSIPGIDPENFSATVTQAVLIPIQDFCGKTVGIQTKTDSGYFWLSSKKKGVSSGAPAHYAGTHGLQCETIRVTEGPLKADVAYCSTEIPTIGITGVTNWPAMAPIIEQAKPSTVHVALDADWRSNKSVRNALVEIIQWLRSRGIKVVLEVWNPEHGKGIDDLLLAGKHPELIEGDEAIDKCLATVTTSQSTDGGLDDLEVGEDPHDPTRLARVNVSSYRDRGGALRFWHGQWWRYRRGVWRFTSEDEIRAKVRIGIAEELIRIHDAADANDSGQKPKRKSLTRSLVSDVLDAMKSQCFLSSSVEMPCWLLDRSQRQLLSVANGLIDIDAVIAGNDVADSFTDHSPDWFSGVQVDYAFDAQATCPRWMEYLSSALPDERSQCLAQEWAGYLLTASNPFQRFLASEGEGGTGKSVYAAGLTAMLGEHSVSNADLSQFGTQFGLGKTIGKALNIDSDVERFAKFSEGAFKKFCIGERMDFQLKGSDPFSQCPTAKVMLLWNERPRIKDTSNGFWRRMLLLPFSIVVQADRRVYGMDQPSWWRDQGELPGLLNWAINGLQRLFSQRRFTEPAAMQSLIRGYRNEMDPVQAFLESMVIDVTSDPNLARASFVGTQSAVAAFRGWCADFASEKDADAMNARRMGKAIAKRFPDATAHIQTMQDETRLRGYLGLQLRLYPQGEQPNDMNNVSRQQSLAGF